MVPISVRIDWNSVFRAVACAVDKPPVEACVARVTAVLSSVVTCDSAPAAVCNSPTPLCEFWAD